MYIHVYVFGAGASKAAVGGPLTNEFLKRGFDGRCLGAIWQVAKPGLDCVAKFIDALHRTRLFDWVQEAGPKISAGEHIVHAQDAPLPASVTIEDLLTYVDLAIEEQRSEWDYRKLQRSLHDFIFATLPFFGRANDCYQQLVNHQVDWSCRNCFISFNYDTFLDQALWLAKPNGIRSNYNLTFDSVTNNWPQYRRMLDEGDAGLKTDLLKLHGSTNWARCEACEDLHLLPLGQPIQTLVKERCEARGCDSRLYPFFVAPTFKKHGEKSGMAQIWQKAEELMSVADHITIIGYSFPDADMEAKWLFKRALAKGGKTPKLTIIDPSPAVRDKIVAFFGNTVNLTMQIPDFETYVARSKENAYREFMVNASHKGVESSGHTLET